MLPVLRLLFSGLALLLAFPAHATPPTFPAKTTVTRPAAEPVAKPSTRTAGKARASLTLFAPQGEIRTVRQVQARFSEDMVRFGDPRVYNPFTVQCAASGKGRWVDTRNWVYDFDADLPAGIACAFTLVKDLRALTGAPVLTFPHYRFTTGGPLVVDSRPRAGISYSSESQLFLVKSNNKLSLKVQPADRGISEEQAFMLKLDGAVDRNTISAHGYCLVQGIKEKIPVRLFSPAEEEEYVSGLKWWDREWWASNSPGRMSEIRRPVVSRVIVACQRHFPNDARVTLVWDRDIASASAIRNKQAQLLGYQVRPEFLANFSCDREAARKPCSPLGNLRLDFTETIRADAIQNIELRSGDKTWKPAPNAEGDGYEDSSSVRFVGPFSPNTGFQLNLPQGVALGNESGRALKNSGRYPLTVKTGDYPPLAKFGADFGIVERVVGAVPLTLRNLEPALPVADEKSTVRTDAQLYTLRLPDTADAFISWLKKDAAFSHRPWGQPAEEVDDPESPGKKIKKPAAPDPRGESFIRDAVGVSKTALPKKLAAREFEVIGIPVEKPGVYIHEVESRYLGSSLLGMDKPMYVHSFSLVTDLAVHFKRGQANSLVWVTSLDKAEPVAGATVEVHDCNAGELLWNGTTDAFGIARIEMALPDVSRSDWREEEGQQPLSKSRACAGASMLITATTADDRGFVLSSWNEGIQPWRYHIDSYYGDDAHFSAHTVLDRSLLRPGETVHMRHFIRARSLTGFAAPSLLPDKVILRHEGSEQEYELAPVFDAGGNADSEWKIPVAAKLGTYTVILRHANTDFPSGSFRVAEFRLPLLKAQLQLPPGPLAYQPALKTDMSLAYLNGGAFPGADITLRGMVDENYAAFPDYDQYSFRTCVGAAGDDLCPPTEGFERSESLAEITGTLDDNGGRQLDVAIPSRVNPASLSLEMEFRDPSGETQTVAASTRYWPASYLPGIRVESWARTGSKVPVDVVVLDTHGERVKNVPVQVNVFLNESISHRTKTVGGFYAYNTDSELKPLPEQCRGKTDAGGRLHCDIAVDASGELRLRAMVTDPAGRVGTASAGAWISGRESWWFSQENTDRIDLVPEKKSYEPGQTMRLQVRMPFPAATALVTTEREGILDAVVQRLSARDPVITLPVKGEYAPNVFVSALVVRGRDDSVQPTALIDLGKPAFKMGLSEVKVGWSAFQLDVKVTSERKRYRIREKARVRVQVTSPSGQALPAGTEVTLAAVDEALLELSANASWNLLAAMMGERGHRIDTATSQLQVVGKRHYGRKALPAGGGGGHGGTTRELFDTLLYWQARAVVNADGVAEFTVPLNDSLSGFRLAAVASAPERFGFGENSIQTFQDLQVISGLPPLLREGDQFNAGFTVRNAGATAQTVRFSAEAAGLTTRPLQQTLILKAGESRSMEFPLQVPAGLHQVDWTIAADSGTASDRMKVSQQVLDPVPEQVIQATLTQLDAGTPYTLPVEKPADALAGGGVDLSFRAHLGDGLEGVQRYFRDYRYSCLEQQLSRAIVLDDTAAWQSIRENLPAYLDDNGLLKLFTPMQNGDPLITAYVLEVLQESGWELPAAQREKMLDALKRFVTGKLRPPVWNFAPLDDDARKLKAMSVLARYHRFEMSMLGSLNVQAGLWPTAMVLDWVNLLQVQKEIPARQQRLDEASMILRSRLSLQGTALMLSRNESNQWWLYSSADVAAVRLFLAAQTLPGWQEDLPRLIRGLALRSQNGHWNTTLANAWAVLAMRRFSERFESVAVAGTTQAQLGSAEKKVGWGESAPEKLRLEWPDGPATLSVQHAGTGKPWLTVQSVVRIPLRAPWSTGYSVEKHILPLQRKSDAQWSAGDVVLVVLNIDAQTDMGWVVVDDPVPAGASLLGRGLGRDSELLKRKAGKYSMWVRDPDFAEYKQDSYRGYYARVDKGMIAVAYVMRLNQSGDFRLPPTRVEAMYAPEMFGMAPNENWIVKP
ncbi:MAG: MG2 domain-containing protein [bacterium]|nr:MG2 domain-containing protein [bacterium]